MLLTIEKNDIIQKEFNLDQVETILNGIIKDNISYNGIEMTESDLKEKISIFMTLTDLNNNLINLNMIFIENIEKNDKKELIKFLGDLTNKNVKNIDYYYKLLY